MVGRGLAPAAARQPHAAAAPVLRLAGLRTRRYPRREFSLEARAGEILGLAGLVGAGRSELALAVFGVEPALGGAIAVDGVAGTIASPRDAIARGIALVPEDRRGAGLVVDLSIRANLSLPSLARHAIAGFVRPRAEAAAARAGVESLRIKAASIEATAATLSGGNQQKVVLAKWLALEPRVLIVDEPTRGIDVGAKAEIYRLLRELAGRGVAVVMISSDLEEVLAVSDRIAVMHEGALAGVLEPAGFSEEAVMRLAVGGASPAA